MKKKILILGSKGQLGSYIKKKLFDSKFSTLGLNCINGNLLNEKLIENIFLKYNPHIVINTAAITNVDDCEIKKKETYKVNAKSLKFLSKCCLKNDSLLIHFSTDYIFSSKKIYSFSEKNSAKPINYYGKSKLIGEKNITNSGCNYLILRISWLFSKNKKNFLNFFLKNINNNKKIKITRNYGSPTSVRLITKILKLFLKKKDIKFKEIFHLSCNGITTWEDIFLHILKKKKIKRTELMYDLVDEISGRSAKRPYCSHLSCKKIEKFLKIDLPNWRQELNYYLNKYGH